MEISSSQISSPSCENHPLLNNSSFLNDFFRFSDQICLIPCILCLIFNIYFYEDMLVTLYMNELSVYTYRLFISLFLVFNIVISLFFTFDFVVKIWYIKRMNEIPNYNLLFLICDFISGPVTFLFSLKVLILFTLYEYQIIFLLISLRIFSVKQIRQKILKIYEMMYLTAPFLLYLIGFAYIFCSIAIIFFKDLDDEDWGNYGKASFSLFQMLTLDNWGNGGLKSYYSQGNWMGMIIVVFNFAFNFCFFNYFVGCLVDYLNFSKEILQKIYKINSGEDEKINSFLKDCIWGNNYCFWIKVSFVIMIVKEILFIINRISFFACLLINLAYCVVYTAHFIVFYCGYSQEIKIKQEEKKFEIILFILHFCSGPLALIVFYCICDDDFVLEYINTLLILKFFTINPLKFMLIDNLTVITTLFPFYLFIFIFVFLIGWIMAMNLSAEVPSLFGSMSLAFFSVMEIITLDGWISSILDEIEDSMTLAALFEIIVILIVHFLLLNIINSLACHKLNIIYMKRSGIQLKNYVVKKDNRNPIIIVKRSIKEIIENSLEIIGLNENFMRSHSKKRKKNLLGHLDKGITLTDPEEIQNYYLLKRVISNSMNTNVHHFSMINADFMERNQKIKVLSELKRKRTMIFSEESPRFRKNPNFRESFSFEFMMNNYTYESYEEEDSIIIAYKGKKVKVSFLYFLKINNNVQIYTYQNEKDLIFKMRMRGNTL